MKKRFNFIPTILLIAFAVSFSSCQSHGTTGMVAQRIKNSFNALFGKEEESDDPFRLVANEEEFYGPLEEEFVPLDEQDLRSHLVDNVIPQPKESPGEGSLPHANLFQNPSGKLAEVFRTFYFHTNEHIFMNKESYTTSEKISKFLKENPHVHIFIQGHCDERGPEAYNLALGARRANFVRTQLVKNGADPEKIHTVSYGKEKPAVLGHNPQAWSKNRRAEFRIYTKDSR